MNVDPGCPPDVRSCLSTVWVDVRHTLAIGYGEAIRLYVFDIATRTDAHTIAISLDSPSPGSLAQLTADVGPIVDSIRFPASPGP